VPAGKLYLIPSLLSDDNSSVVSFQLKEILQSLNCFIVENEKTARHFLKAAGYPQPLQNAQMQLLNEHTQQDEISSLLKPILNGKDAGLISEAGCPAVADPGSDLVRLAHEKNIQVIPLVGPSSILLALMASGLNGQSFSFVGYLPREKSDRIKTLKELERNTLSKNQTQIFIEAPYRNQHVLEDILAHLSKDISLCLAVELTSKNEFVKTKTIGEWKKNIPDINKKATVFLIGR